MNFEIDGVIFFRKTEGVLNISVIGVFRLFIKKIFFAYKYFISCI